MERLTDEQRELAAKNHNLIYKYAHKKNVSAEDYYGILAIGLCKAAASYDKSKGKFSTLAMTCMNNEYQSSLRHENRKSAIPDTVKESYDNVIENEDGNCISKEFIDEKSYLEMVNGNLEKEFLECLDKKEKNIVEFLISGKTHQEISDIMDCTRQNVTFCVGRIRRKFVKFMSYN